MDEAELRHRLELVNEFEDLFMRMVEEKAPIKRIQLEGVMYERIKFLREALEMRVRHELGELPSHDRRIGDK